jgi:hypothetical protein
VGYGFFNGSNNYGQEELARYFSNIYENGVNVTDSDMGMKVTRYSGTDLKVAIGFSIVNGYYLYQDVIKTITVDKDTTYNRIDRVVVRLDVSNMTVSIELKQGTASSKPAAPILTRTSGIYELSLAQIYIDSSNGITSVTDERYDINLCGAIRPKNLSEFNSMMIGFNNRFDTWFEQQQGEGWRNIYIQSSRPTGAIEGAIWKQVLS